jgi:hypothetical protein
VGALRAQVRVPVAEVAGVVRQLVDGTTSWQQVQGSYPAVQRAAEAEDAA